MFVHSGAPHVFFPIIADCCRTSFSALWPSMPVIAVMRHLLLDITQSTILPAVRLPVEPASSP
jgi:hypothetical protein